MKQTLVNFFLSLTLFCFCYQQIQGEPLPKKALIFGATGQDGTYLAEFLLNKNYEVHGVSRHSIVSGIYPGHHYHHVKLASNEHFFSHLGDITNYETVLQLIQKIQPDEIYNLAAQSSVKTSFDMPLETFDINSFGTLRILEAIRQAGCEKKVRFFQATSSELYGLAQETPQSEETPFNPCSPYGVTKLCSYWLLKNYRDTYGYFACTGILFNHESPLRGENFVSRKITLGASRYKLGLQDTLYIGNLDVERDWGYAQDYVEAMWLMLQQDQPDDFVIASGESHSVREFIEVAFKLLDIEIEWVGKGVDEVGIDKNNRNTIVKVDPKFYRPTDSNFIIGKAAKAERKLHWQAKMKFQDLVRMMVEADYNVLK